MQLHCLTSDEVSRDECDTHQRAGQVDASTIQIAIEGLALSWPASADVLAVEAHLHQLDEARGSNAATREVEVHIGQAHLQRAHCR